MTKVLQISISRDSLSLVVNVYSRKLLLTRQSCVDLGLDSALIPVLTVCHLPRYRLFIILRRRLFAHFPL